MKNNSEKNGLIRINKHLPIALLPLIRPEFTLENVHKQAEVRNFCTSQAARGPKNAVPLASIRIMT